MTCDIYLNIPSQAIKELLLGCLADFLFIVWQCALSVSVICGEEKLTHICNESTLFSLSQLLQGFVSWVKKHSNSSCADCTVWCCVKLRFHTRVMHYT